MKENGQPETWGEMSTGDRWGAMITLAVILGLIGWFLVACTPLGPGGDETDSGPSWCQQTRQFWVENPGDSNPQLERAYSRECG